jgi:hypothetical protein
MRLLLLFTLVLAGCAGEPEQSISVSKDFKVDRLFTHEGCTVYRFEDGGYLRYFTNCHGGTSWSTTHHNGKTTYTTKHEIPTEVSK